MKRFHVIGITPDGDTRPLPETFATVPKAVADALACLETGQLARAVIVDVTDEHTVLVIEPSRDEEQPMCQHYQPDHNGECLECDEPADAHRRRDEVLTLYRSMRTDELRRLRVAFTLDATACAGHPASVAFCHGRIAVIDRVLQERGEAPDFRP